MAENFATFLAQVPDTYRFLQTSLNTKYICQLMTERYQISEHCYVPMCISAIRAKSDTNLIAAITEPEILQILNNWCLK